MCTGNDPGLLALLLDLLPGGAFAGQPVVLMLTGGLSEHAAAGTLSAVAAAGEILRR
ncbi:MAG: hypothetical protein JOY92_12295 [Verrucomicrobia bacterium]|nr:hypothetical protein [Verrucomicrobiota bacterium]